MDVSPGTVDQWFAERGFSSSALATIKLLMQRDEQTAAPTNDTGLIQFTVDEFERIESARKRAGYETRPPFYRDAILKQVEAMEAEMPTLRLPKPITYLPAAGSKPDAELRMADEPSNS